MNSYYKLLPTTDLRKDEETILEVLLAIKANRLSNDLRLLNYYREVPISFGATIDDIDRGMVEMGVHRLQAALMGLQKETLIRSEHLSYDVLAKVNRADADRDTAFLSHFSHVQILTDRRAHVRVAVSEKIDVLFRVDKMRLQGRIKDISIGGMAFIAPEVRDTGENMKGTTEFSLKGNRLEFPAVLLSMDEEPPEKRYVLRFNADNKSEAWISQYVFQTQSQIIRELKDKYT